MRAAAAGRSILLTLLLSVPQSVWAQSSCATWQECRELAIAARASGDNEVFHDLAWRAVQSGPRNDAALLLLLARAQSLSGRPHDAQVMLERLLGRGIDVSEAETSEDFRRLRALPGWLDLAQRIRTTRRADERRAAEADTEVPPTEPSTMSKTATTVAPSSRSTPRPGPIRGAPDTTAAPAGGRLSPPGPAPPSAGPSASKAPLSLPPSIRMPSAIAYDRVSGRLVMADTESETLKVVSELSGTAVDLVSRGWGGPYRTRAIAIDATRGDLWVVATAVEANTSPAAMLHRVQLISGRLLYSVPAATDRGAVEWSSLAVSGSRVLVLDSAGSRLFELTAGQKVLRERARVGKERAAAVALAGAEVAYVAHAAGIERVSLTSGRAVAVQASTDVAVDNLRWIGHHRRSLVGLQQQPDGSYVAVRLRLDSRGRRVTAREVLGLAVSPAAAIMGDEFFFVAPQPDGSTAIHRLALP